jgi:hypothetical protein
MAQTAEEEYLAMGRKTRIDLALSLDVHRPNAGAYATKFIFDLKKHGDPGKQKLAAQLANGQFDLNKDTNPLFRKYINDRLKSENWIKEQIERLTYIMLWDVLSVTQPTEFDLYDKKEIPDGYFIEQKEAQRLIHEYYGHMHTRPIKWSYKWEKIADDPRYIVWSFGGPRLTRQLPKDDKRLKTIGTSLTMKNPWPKEIRIEDFADPYYLERLFAYRKTVEWMLYTIEQKTTKRRTGMRRQYRWVIDELLHNDYALTVLFQNAAREVEKRWFEKNLGPESKVRTIYRICRGFTEEEIKKVISAYTDFCEELENRKQYSPFKLSVEKATANAIEQITLAAADYANRGYRKLPKLLFSNLLNSSFKLVARDRAMIEHNLGIFEMINKEYTCATDHFESALEFWAKERHSLLEEIDTWNLCLALECVGKEVAPERHKGQLFDTLVKSQDIGLRLFLIRQFADISNMFGDVFASKRWLAKGIIQSADIEEFHILSLHFEERLGSSGVMGIIKEERQSAEEYLQSLREKYCTILGNTENFAVCIDKKFYLLKEDIAKSIVK